MRSSRDRTKHGPLKGMPLLGLGEGQGALRLTADFPCRSPGFSSRTGQVGGRNFSSALGGFSDVGHEPTAAAGYSYEVVLSSALDTPASSAGTDQEIQRVIVRLVQPNECCDLLVT